MILSVDARLLICLFMVLILITSEIFYLSVGDVYEVTRTSLELTRNIFPAFFAELQHSGWITSHVLLGADEWRATWGAAMQ